MQRRGAASILANPVLVGAVTTLVVIVAVFLAYNANSGLPFVPTRQLNVQIANGANLGVGNEVREGGYRIGLVEEMRPVALPGGKVGAELRLKLDRAVGEIPVDSTLEIRPRSALGLKYVELNKGTSSEVVPDGGLLPESNTSIPVELDQFYNMFDEETRDASRENLRGFGNAFAGRGADLNRAIAELPRLFGNLEPVAANLASRRTNLRDFFGELADFTRVVAPVSAQQARLFTTMADTFEAIGRDPQALKDTISKSPETLDVGTRSLRAQRPFLTHTARLSRDLRFATDELRRTLPTVNSALDVATPVTRRSTALYGDLEAALVALRDLTKDPRTDTSVRALTGTVDTLQPQLRFYGPYVTVCNYWNFFWTFNAEHFTAPDPTGSSERAMINTAGVQADSYGSTGANEPMNGKNVIEGRPQHLHGSTNGAAVDPEGRADCEIGQRGYVSGRNKLGSPFYRRVDLDAHDTINAGPTFRMVDREARGVGLNPDRVPAGQTFTREPGGIGLKAPTPQP